MNRIVIILALFCCATSAFAQTSQGDTTQAPRIWRGPDNTWLPFRTDAEIMAFMREAEVISVKEVGQGSTNPWKVMIEKDGIRMNTIFRYVHETVTIKNMFQERNVRDDYIFVCAAYTLGQLLGLDNIPPVVPRKIKGMDGKMRNGSMQIWLEKAFTEEQRKARQIEPNDRVRWNQDKQTLELYDTLIYNDDANPANVMYDQQFKLWMVDHTRTFQPVSDLFKAHTEYLKQVDRVVWEKLRTVEDITIQLRLKPFLKGYEIDALLKRRRKLVAYIQKLIDTNGEEAVLFTR